MDDVKVVEADESHSNYDNSGQQEQQPEPMSVDNEPDVSLFQQAAEICTEEMFDWMALVDLHAVSRTCKQMQQLAGYFFRLNYAGALVECKKGNIFIGDVRINGLCEEIQNIAFCDDDWRSFEFAKSHKFEALKRVKFHGISFTNEKITSILHILEKAEAVELYKCSIDGAFYRKFLRHCEAMQQLVLEPTRPSAVNSSNVILGFDAEYTINGYPPPIYSFIGINNTWLLRKYPKLVHFGLHTIGYGDYQTKELTTFFGRNPNIRKFSTFADNFPYLVSEWLDEANLPLDDLALKLEDFESEMFYGLYESLPKNEFSKRTQLYDMWQFTIYEQYRHEFPPVELDKCHFFYKSTLDVGCYPLMHASFREICIWYLPTDDGIDEMASTLVNLEQISIKETTPKGIGALISRSAKLKTITVVTVEGNGADINLLEWNRQREELAGAGKVTVYVDEKTYLTVKWATHDMRHKFVELKRFESCKWEHDFDYRY